MRNGLMARLRASVRAAMRSIVASPSAAILALTIAAGCSWPTPAPVPPSPPAAPGSPQVITDLSQLSSQNPDAASLNSAAEALKSTPLPGETPSPVVHGPLDATPSTLRRLFLNHPESSRYTETPIPHTEERLLNAKAAEYPGLANMILTQLLDEMVKLEKKEPIVTLQLPDSLKPVIVTAILNDQGRLKELIYQQHSGLAAVDDLVISACKESLWVNNLPASALNQDGLYRLRIEAQLSKYSADREDNQTFITRVGLGIL